MGRARGSQPRPVARPALQHDADRRLATLGTNARIGTKELGELEWRGVPRDAFITLCEELGFTRIRERVHRWAA